MRNSRLESLGSEVSVNPAGQSDRGYTSDTNEAVSSRLGTSTSSESSDGSRNSSTRRHRRSPPPPPLRRMAPSIDSHLSLETSSNSGGDSPRRSHSVRRPAPPPPRSPRQSRTPRSPTNVSSPSHGPSPLDPATIASITQFAQRMASMATEGLSTQAPGRQGVRRSGYVTTTKTNCIDINDSNVDGLTLNNGGTNNSGAVIHRTMMPAPRLPQRVTPL
ncbi:hypothetical protein OG21DRAFT_1508497 [Imleria badia]|nr:hypothetical protein OG21DRAFT_1508497 [Imleria badia]